MLLKTFFLICILIAFFITIRALQKFSYSEETLNSFIEQFQLKYIEDIKVIFIEDKDTSDSYPNCPLNYENLIETLNWPGSSEGCGCPSQNKNPPFTFYSNDCPLFEKNCIEYEETGLINFPYYSNILLCAKRSEKNYLDLIPNIIPSTADINSVCNNSTHRVCGQIDEGNNFLCFSRDIPCPVNKLIITNNETEVNLLKQKGSDIIIESNQNNSLFVIYSKGVSVNPIFNKFKLDFTQPCLNGFKNPSSEVIFELMKNKFDYSCDKFEKNNSEILDTSYTNIYSIKYDDYISQNYFKDVFKKIKETFSINTDNTYVNLYAKRYPGWSNNIDPDSIKNFINTPEILRDLSLFTFIHSFIIVGILIGLGVCAFYFSENFEKIFYFIILGHIILNLIYPVQVITNSNWIINNYSDEKGIPYGDKSLKILLTDIIEACNSLLIYYAILLFINGLCVIVYIYLIRTWIKPTIKELQERLIQLRQIR
ncbi:MAG: hypothetical protein MJ252_03165 [archaeon]|nr:hypothetical protein [archaeon]